MTPGESIIHAPRAEDRAQGTLRSELAWQAGRAGQEILTFLGRAGELAPVLEALRNAAEERGERLKLVIPQEILDAVQRGDWSWVEARDGSGILPTVQDLDGNFVKQVRLVKERIPVDREAITNAAAHAQTHAMLRQILEKLEIMDQKLDLLLAGQRDAWIGQIIAGMRSFKVTAAEPGPSDDLVLANALQSLDEGRSVGLRALRTQMKAPPPVPSILSMSMGQPSSVRAMWLDARREEIVWVYAATRTVAAIYSAQNRPLAARSAMSELAAELESLEEPWADVLAFAAYTPERERFWQVEVPALRSAKELATTSVAIETSLGELEALHAEVEPAPPPAAGGGQVGSARRRS